MSTTAITPAAFAAKVRLDVALAAWDAEHASHSSDEWKSREAQRAAAFEEYRAASDAFKEFSKQFEEAEQERAETLLNLAVEKSDAAYDEALAAAEYLRSAPSVAAMQVFSVKWNEMQDAANEVDWRTGKEDGCETGRIIDTVTGVVCDGNSVQFFDDGVILKAQVIEI